jgi:hypothetical protein
MNGLSITDIVLEAAKDAEVDEETMRKLELLRDEES